MKDLAIVIPTFKEAGNIGLLLNQLAPLKLRVIVVDDNSPDGTADVVRSLRWPELIVRENERGLSSAVRAGARLAGTQSVLVMDADGQHAASDVQRMLDAWRTHPNVDLIIGSRFAPGAVLTGLSWRRKMLSKSLNAAANALAKTKSTDLMTGFAIAPTEFVLKTRTNAFKWLLEACLNVKLPLAEVPINFNPRMAGKSKASFKELMAVLKTPRWE